ncbi:39S ribosomal protein L52, mitochondrial [Fopius arisanus]|uniref:Large ribosomal subunit protein mL52 n=1 Tax=Fopius arisanus TaxID=64838 RepID=A0A0C9RAJ1_9HYME|nr:PREDICTED: 39S ribosomal protein L52, mitochondrial [Fopius arisanus]
MMSLFSRLFTHTRFIRHVVAINNLSGIHTTCVTRLDQGWRRKMRLPENPNAFGPLTNLPDYSFADGRPTPFGTRMLNRINKQREILKRVRTLTSEVDYAVQRYERIQGEKAKYRKSILESKLKPKGTKLAIAMSEVSKKPPS